jgi:L-ascorbate metabolism protein UlaG (beta-lactamase superfamily)
MQQPAKGPALIREITAAAAVEPRLRFYVDPWLTDPSVLLADEVSQCDLLLATRVHPRHLDVPSARKILETSRRAKVLLPRARSTEAHQAGIPYERMTTTDSGLRVEYFKSGTYARIYAVPSASPELDHHAPEGYPYLGYLVRCGDCTFYHAGESVPYESLASQLQPYNITVAMVPISKESGYTPEDACNLAATIGARWLVPMHAGAANPVSLQPFVDYMLFHRPEQRFKTFAPGEGWQVPNQVPE